MNFAAPEFFQFRHCQLSGGVCGGADAQGDQGVFEVQAHGFRVQDVLFDPQTSGGLLICLDKDSADDLLQELKEKGIHQAAIIGEVVSEPKERIVVP